MPSGCSSCGTATSPFAALSPPRRADHVVLVTEPNRSLGPRDVADVLGAVPITVVPWDPAVARAIDAGLLAARLPRCLGNAVEQLVRPADAS